MGVVVAALALAAAIALWLYTPFRISRDRRLPAHTRSWMATVALFSGWVSVWYWLWLLASRGGTRHTVIDWPREQKPSEPKSGGEPYR